MSDEKRNENEKKRVVIEPKSGELHFTGGVPSLWTMATFSPQWFADALHEATTGSDENSIRREIVFSTCFLESYIFEWARDIIRDVDIAAVDDYFPRSPRFAPQRDPRCRRKLKKKWKEVPRELFKDGKIGIEPKLTLSDLGKLVEIRNNVVHAAYTGRRPQPEYASAGSS